MYKIYSNTLFVGRNIIYLPECHSTNEWAASHLKNNIKPEGNIIITDNQTAGKGQRGNSWESEPEKNLTFSVIFQPKFLDPNENFYLNIFVSLAIHDSLSTFLDKDHVKIKWPNDIFYNKQKLCGILIENFVNPTQITNSITGIGINVNQDHFKTPGAISMLNILQKESDKNLLLSKLALNLENRYLQLKNYEFSTLKSNYYDHLYWMHEIHTFYDNDFFKGSITGIDQYGRLIIETKQGIKYFHFKAVKFIR